MKTNPAATLAGALTLALTAGAALSAPNPTGSFKDWRAACDNVGDCMAVGFTQGEYAVGPYAVVTQRGGPDAPPGVSIVLTSADDEAGEGAEVTLTVKGGLRPFSFTGRAASGADDASAHLDLEGTGATGLIAAMANGATIDVTVDGKPWGAVSLSGSSAALRWIDDRQGRAGGVTALIAKGPRPASAVPAARPVPVVLRAAAVSQDNLPADFPAALEARADVKACAEEQADPNGDFGSATAEARLSADEYLWSVPCGRGAYNFTSFYLIAHADGSGARSPGIGKDDTAVNGGYDAEGRLLGAFDKGRGFGDCGEADTWAWDGRRFQLIHHAEMDECRAVSSGDWLVTWQAEFR